MFRIRDEKKKLRLLLSPVKYSEPLLCMCLHTFAEMVTIIRTIETIGSQSDGNKS